MQEKKGVQGALPSSRGGKSTWGKVPKVETLEDRRLKSFQMSFFMKRSKEGSSTITNEGYTGVGEKYGWVN